MFAKRFALSAVLAAFPAIAQVPTLTDSGVSAAKQIIPRQHAPNRLQDDGTGNSKNWSGYAVTGSTYTQALGSWIVPTVDCTLSPNTYAAFWVGLDGYSSETVEQTGTDSDCEGMTAVYYAWYEFYPAVSILIPSVGVHPGNKMSAKVNYRDSEFTVTITNESTGKTFSKSSKVSGAVRSSAEWIAEAPCCTNRGGILPLSDFGTVDFGLDYTGVTGTNEATTSTGTGTIGSFGSTSWERIKMTASGSGSGVPEADPSALSSDGTSFTVLWKSE